MKKFLLFIIAIISLTFTSFKKEVEAPKLILFYQDENITIYHHPNVQVEDKDSLMQRRFLKNYIKWEFNLR